jgi:hypothetical protein
MSDLTPKIDVGAVVTRIGMKWALLSTGPIGAALVTVIEEVMPALRAERLTTLASELNDLTTSIPGDVLGLRVREPERFDLLEDAMWQAARASTRERIAHLANVVANGLKAEDARELDRRHVLKLLAEVNDVEVLILRRHGFMVMERRAAFTEKHPELWYEPATYGSTRAETDRSTVQADYDEHLLRLGLLRMRYSRAEIEKPKFDSTGRLEGDWMELSEMGQLLLREIGCPADFDAEPTT